ncbi:MAG: hypothetical protein ACD_15C00042G0005 [uncultured bacterium]|nr:MAG: hypothetical protein ACD_15C00042G0005 [uncultured bacterium]
MRLLKTIRHSGLFSNSVESSEAREKLKKDEPDNYEGKFTRARDLRFLEEAKSTN